MLEALIDLLEDRVADILQTAQSKINIGQHCLGTSRCIATCDFAAVPFGYSPWDATAEERKPVRLAELPGRPLLLEDEIASLCFWVDQHNAPMVIATA